MGILKDYAGSYIAMTLFYALPYGLRKRITARRLKSLLAYARENIPYYRDLIPADAATLDGIPLTDKATYMAHFDQTLADPRLNKEIVLNYLDNPDTPLLFEKYTVSTTSGSTGLPLVAVQDKRVAIKNALAGNTLFRVPVANIGSNSRTGITANTINRSKNQSSAINKMVRMFNVDGDHSEAVAALNAYQPNTLSGFPGSIDRLVDDVDAGTLHIRPKRILLSGEMTTPAIRARLTHAFPTADIRGFYGCTEGGFIASGCKCGHLHLREDIAILEAVDKDGNILPTGQKGEQVALTSLTNRAQPFIRYIVDDKITLHEGKCECGKRGIWFEIEGRTRDHLSLKNQNGDIVSIAPIHAIDAVDEITCESLRYVRRSQIIGSYKDGNSVTLRVEYYPDADKDEANALLTEALEKLLSRYGLTATIVIEDAPLIINKSGKISRIIMQL